ncbi:MAG: hypothetical protein LBT15_00520 [Synergistaceae bacterium]|jgi:hypothetical protein|nr:hypothetical protein [Synergistaceae bacterium]
MTAPAGFEKLQEKLVEKGFVAGLKLESLFPEYKNAYLFCATEVHTRDVLDAFLDSVSNPPKGPREAV